MANYLKKRSGVVDMILVLGVIFVVIFAYARHQKQQQAINQKCMYGITHVLEKKTGNYIVLYDKFDNPIRCGEVKK